MKVINPPLKGGFAKGARVREEDRANTLFIELAMHGIDPKMSRMAIAFSIEPESRRLEMRVFHCDSITRISASARFF